MGSGYEPLLISGPVGSLPIECAKEIHRAAGGGNFERVNCTPDSISFRTQVFGTTPGFDEEYNLFDPDPPTGAVQRAVGGTLFFDYIDRCNPADVDWLRALIDRQPAMVNGGSTELDQGTRVIASTTTDWAETVGYMLPSWMVALFGERVVIIEPLDSRPADVWQAIQWFSWQSVQERPEHQLAWSSEAKELLLGKQWPGGHGQLRSVVNSLISSTAIGDTIDFDVCQSVLSRYDEPGMRPVDQYRRQECSNYAREIVYMGRQISADEIYNWIEQFSKFSADRRFDSWSVALQIVRQISNTYYYSSDRLRVLVRKAYSSLCVELGDKGFLPNAVPVEPNTVSNIKALLVNPLGPVKSSAAMVPHIAHLLGAGFGQQMAPLHKVAEQLSANEDIQIVLFCDDFAGTGRQIANNLVGALAKDRIFRDVCQKRSRSGKPVVLAIVLAVGFSDALSKIRTSGTSWLPVIAHAGEYLESCDRVFSENSTIFPEPEVRGWAKALMVDQIGSCLSSKWPGGFGDLQALVITADNAPNDTLPVVCMSGVVQGIGWKALFERASSPSF